MVKTLVPPLNVKSRSASPLPLDVPSPRTSKSPKNAQYDAPRGCQAQDVFKINVGGKLHWVGADTLAPKTFLHAALISRDFGPHARDAEGNPYINRDGDIFKHVNQYLRSWTIPHDLEPHELEELQEEARFFMLPKLADGAYAQRILRLIEAHPNDPELACELVYARVAAGMGPALEEAWDRLCGLDPMGGVTRQFVTTRFRDDPADWAAHYLQARLLAKTDKIAAIQAFLHAAAAGFPDSRPHAAIWYLIDYTVAANVDLTRACCDAFAKAATDFDYDWVPPVGHAWCLKQLGEQQRAHEILVAAAAKFPSELGVQLYLARSCRDLDLHEEAAIAYEAARQLAGGTLSFANSFDYARALANANKIRPAYSVLSEALEREPQRRSDPKVVQLLAQLDGAIA